MAAGQGFDGNYRAGGADFSFIFGFGDHGIMEAAYFAVGLIGFGLGVLLTWLAMRAREERADLERRVSELEKRNRHSHRTIAGLEDATAVLIDAEIEVEALMARLRTAHRIIGQTREGPEAYSNKEWDTDLTDKHGYFGLGIRD